MAYGNFGGGQVWAGGNPYFNEQTGEYQGAPQRPMPWPGFGQGRAFAGGNPWFNERGGGWGGERGFGNFPPLNGWFGSMFLRGGRPVAPPNAQPGQNYAMSRPVGNFGGSGMKGIWQPGMFGGGDRAVGYQGGQRFGGQFPMRPSGEPNVQAGGFGQRPMWGR